MFRAARLCFSVALLLVAGFVVLNCGGGMYSTTNTTTGPSAYSSASISLSDPATCAGASSTFAHVYVTITDVQVHTSPTAAATDTGWQDITPGLSSAPKQIDLLGQANNQCFLATLGATTQLQPGTYQQIRVILADNSTAITNNACGNTGANCVVPNSDNRPHTLLLSSEAKTGIKIPSGQIASGGFKIAAGETRDLNIDFDTCASIVQQGNGQYRLKPVLHAGEVSTTATSINGKVVSSATNAAVAGSVLVALEQKDAAGNDRIVMTTLANADGTFVFCPIPAGTYDVVVVGISSGGMAFAPSILTGITNGQTTGTITLYTPPSGALSATTLNGSVTTQSSSTTGTVADIQLSALASVSSGVYTIPLLPNGQQTSATLALATAAASTCPTNTDCAPYSIVLPTRGAYIGAYSTSTPVLTEPAPLATYTLDGIATVPSSGGTLDCTNSEVKTQPIALTASSITVSTGTTLSFSGCQ